MQTDTDRYKHAQVRSKCSYSLLCFIILGLLQTQWGKLWTKALGSDNNSIIRTGLKRYTNLCRYWMFNYHYWGLDCHLQNIQILHSFANRSHSSHNRGTRLELFATSSTEVQTQTTSSTEVQKAVFHGLLFLLGCTTLRHSYVWRQIKSSKVLLLFYCTKATAMSGPTLLCHCCPKQVVHWQSWAPPQGAWLFVGFLHFITKHISQISASSWNQFLCPGNVLVFLSPNYHPLNWSKQGVIIVVVHSQSRL